MRIFFMASGDIAIPTLEFLIKYNSYDLVGLCTQPDKPIGRKQIVKPSEIKSIAELNDIPVYQPDKLINNKEIYNILKSLDIDFLIVMAYGHILPESIIDLPNVATLNLHASLLPKHRGASPIQSSILSGDKVTGLTLMKMIFELDAGDIILKREVPILDEDTGGAIHDKLSNIAPDLLSSFLFHFQENNIIKSTPQLNQEATYCHKLIRKNGELDFKNKVSFLERKIRSYDPWPGTFFRVNINGQIKKVKVFPKVNFEISENSKPGKSIIGDKEIKIGCLDGNLIIYEDIQLEGKKRIHVKEFLQGNKNNFEIVS